MAEGAELLNWLLPGTILLQVFLMSSRTLAWFAYCHKVIFVFNILEKRLQHLLPLWSYGLKFSGIQGSHDSALLVLDMKCWSLFELLYHLHNLLLFIVLPYK